jgi:hypothetical protein
MIRRNARLRKEYIYRKSLEGTEREVYEKKRKIKDSLASTFLKFVTLIFRTDMWFYLVVLSRGSSDSARIARRLS